MISSKELWLMLDHTEENYLIKLGLADRMLIKSKIREHSYFPAGSFTPFVRNILKEFGYPSPRI